MEPNPRHRSYMEDVAVIVDPFLSGESVTDQWGYYAVYDGHGGRMAVDYVEANLHSLVCNELRAVMRGGGTINDTRIAHILHRCFNNMDENLKHAGAWKCGCTATVALVQRTGSRCRLHVANVGDSSAIVIDSRYQGRRISFDHRPVDISEVLRVEADGGFIARGRVNGQLGVSRALGDHWLKMCGVTGSPSISSVDVTDDVALVIASDGLWDALREADVARLIEQRRLDSSPERIADMLVREAQRCGSTDNISCVVCLLRGRGSERDT